MNKNIDNMVDKSGIDDWNIREAISSRDATENNSKDASNSKDATSRKDTSDSRGVKATAASVSLSKLFTKIVLEI